MKTLLPLCLLLLGSGCLVPPDFGEERLLLFAAASTSDAVREALSEFEKESGLGVVVNLAASSTLAEQIRAGAEADLFLSANLRWVDLLEEEGFVVRRRELLGNRLVLVQSVKASVPVEKPSDLLSERVGRVSISDPEGVPAGMYARQAFMKLGLWESLSGKMVRCLDVRQALLFAERGEVEAGVVYATDAAISAQVEIRYTFDESLTDPILYSLALMREAKPQEAVLHLYKFLSSPASMEIFRRYGFAIMPAAGS